MKMIFVRKGLHCEIHCLSTIDLYSNKYKLHKSI